MSALLEYSDQFRAPIWMVVVRLVVILAVAWIVGKILSKKLASFPAPSKGTVIFAAVLAWVVLFSVGMLRHLTFHSKAWDLAIFDQVIWNLAHGYGWECSVRGVQDLRGDHFEPILLLFVPIYRMLPHVGWLLGAQAAALVGAGTILWATYRKRIGDTPAFMLLLAFLFYPAVHWLSIADFHPIALAPFFIMVAWWGRERERAWAFAVGLVGLAMCGEEGFVVAGWWGLWEFAVRIRKREGRSIGWIGLVSMAVFWAGFVYLSIVYIPSHRVEGAGYFYVHRYAYLGHSLGDIAGNFFTRPGLWIGHLADSRSGALLALYLVPLGLVPLMRPKYLALLVPTIIYTLLSDSLEQKSIFHQYTAMWIPFLMIAAAEFLTPPVVPPIRMGGTVSSGTGMNSGNSNIAVPPIPMGGTTGGAALALFTASFLGFLAFSPIFGLSMHPELFQPESWAGEAAWIVSNIGPDEPVSAPSALCPHLSHRRVLLLRPADQWPGVDKVLELPDFPPVE